MTSPQIISRDKLILGVEWLTCPQCKRQLGVEINTDMPDVNWLPCPHCGYKALINLAPILDKYGIPHGASRPEKQQIGQQLKKIAGKEN
jgi:DNA-directed RNA polymerase subunit RPC12/RpoP